MFDINNLEILDTLNDGDQTLILRFDDNGVADLLQCDFSMLHEHTTSIWYNGTYAPAGTTTPNSYYINTHTGEIYSSTSSTSNGVTTTTWQSNPIMKITGATGENGVDGQNAYQVAVSNGYTGTVTQWLASLVGANGPDGTRTYFVYSVPTGPISDSRGYCRIGDYAIVTFAKTGESDPQAGQTYVYAGAGKWTGPLTISKATTGPMGPPISLTSSSSITTTETTSGVWQVSLAQNYLSLDASSNLDQTINQGANAIAYSITNSASAKMDIGVSLVGSSNVLTLSSPKTTGISVVNNNGDKAYISPDGSYLDSTKISTDGAGNLTAVSFIGTGNSISVTDPTTNTTNNLKSTLANVFNPESGFVVVGQVNDSLSDKTTTLNFWNGTNTSGTPSSKLSLSPTEFDFNLTSVTNTYILGIDTTNGFVLGNKSSSRNGTLKLNDTGFNFKVIDTSTSNAISSLSLDNYTLSCECISLNYSGSLSISDNLFSYKTSSLSNPQSSCVFTMGNGGGISFVDEGLNGEQIVQNILTVQNGGATIASISGTKSSVSGFSLRIAKSGFSVQVGDGSNITSGMPCVINYDGTSFQISSKTFSVDKTGFISASNISTSVAEGLTSSGTSLSTALTLTNSTNVVTTVSSGTGVALSNVAIGTIIRVLNRGKNTLLIYPESSSSQIESLAAGAGQEMLSGGSGAFMKTSSSMWRVV